MSYLTSLPPRIREAWLAEVRHAEMVLALHKLWSECEPPKPPPPKPVRVVTWFEQPNPYWDRPTPS
jgi:hypothetical protein